MIRGSQLTRGKNGRARVVKTTQGRRVMRGWVVRGSVVSGWVMSGCTVVRGKNGPTCMVKRDYLQGDG